MGQPHKLSHEFKEEIIMFYVKEKINDAMEVTVEINDENVFCTCPKCGIEVQVNLEDFVGDEHFDLFGTAVCCEDCSRKMLRKVERIE